MIILALLPAYTASLFGNQIGIRLTESNGEIVQELLAKDSKGVFQRVLLSPTHPDVKAIQSKDHADAVALPSSGLFTGRPTFGFTKTTVDKVKRTITLTADNAEAKVIETITVPLYGQIIDIKLDTHLKSPTPQIDHLLATYAFAPGTPDTTWIPGLRNQANRVIGDHFFRSPAAMAQKGRLTAAIMPDLDVLADNRPIPTIIDLNCKNGVTNLPLLSYGFCDHKLVAHVAYAHDASMAHAVPPNLKLGFQIRLDANSIPSGGYEPIADYMWKRYGSKYIDKAAPQAIPFEEYAKYCYPAAFTEKDTGGWFEKNIDGHICGGLPSGWGLGEGWVSWQDWFCQIRSAWGLNWWGKKTGNKDWIDKSEKMLNLALAAPMNGGACPTTYQSKTNTWKGCLVTPSKDCYYDLTNIAWKGLWLLKWADLRKDCPRQAEVAKQIRQIADLLIAKQNTDGSFPTWLDKDLKKVPILDRSAQSALPVWFLTQIAGGMSVDRELNPYMISVRKGAEFLSREVVDQQRYYDFETFFSCSPKVCLQRDYKLDDASMIDPYTLQRPQNTLSMQWTAEALRAASFVMGYKPEIASQYMGQAFKALDMMCLYQEVWPISYIKTANVYGGFGVQNSDGEYDDARQAQFAETLCSFGAMFGRKDWFERGVAAARSTLALINHPLHAELGIYPNPNYPPGLEPENCGHGGTDEQNGRSGFDWAEGSGLTTMAILLDSYGRKWKSPQFGWEVTVDAFEPGQHLTKPRTEVANEKVFDFSQWSAPGWTFEGDIISWPMLGRRVNFGNMDLPFIGTCEDGKGAFNDKLMGSATSPSFKTTHKRIKLLVGGGEGEGVYVELLDAQGKQVYVEHGHNSETMDERTWDIANVTQPMQIRIVDKEQAGWGHINVGNIRFVN